MRKIKFALIAVVMVLALVSCQKEQEVEIAGVKYGQYGSAVFHGEVLVDSDLSVDGTTNIDDLDIDLSGELEIDGGLTDFGGCTAGVADGDNDVCIAAVLEVDGELEADGAIDADSDLDVDGTSNLDDVDIDLSASLNIDGHMVDIGTCTTPATADSDNDLCVAADAEIDGVLDLDGSPTSAQFGGELVIEAGGKISVGGMITGTTGAIFVCIGTHTHTDAETVASVCHLPANSNVIDLHYLITTDWNDGTSATVDCGIEGGDVNAFLAAVDLNGVGNNTFARMGSGATYPAETAMVDVGAAAAHIICQVAEGANDASEGSATLYLFYTID